MKCNNCSFEFNENTETERECPNCGVDPTASGDPMNRHALEQNTKMEMEPKGKRGQGRPKRESMDQLR